MEHDNPTDPDPSPDTATHRPGDDDPASGPWHHNPTFDVTGIHRDPHPGRGPPFAADSPTALIVLTSIVGPTAVLTLRTLAIVARTGPTSWHIADLAGMHGVTNNTMRHALDRLHRFDWLRIDTLGRADVYLSGSLSPRQIDRLRPTIADHYLAIQSRNPSPPPTADALRGGPNVDPADSDPHSSAKAAEPNCSSVAHHIVDQWAASPVLDAVQHRLSPPAPATSDLPPM